MQGLSKVCKLMKERDMDIAILVDAANIKYVSGFEVPFWAGWMWDVSNHLPMVTAFVDANAQTVKLVASDLYKNKILRTGIMDAEIFRSFTHLEKNNADENYAASFSLVLQEMSEGKESLVIGIEPNYTTQGMLSILMEVMPGADLANATSILNKCRYIKTLEDIRGIQEAARIADVAQETLYEISQCEGDYTELDIWFEVQNAVSHAAGVLTPFIGELVTGPRAALSDYPLGPTTRKIERGDIAIMDISPQVNGYWGDCSNSVVFWAEPDDEQKKYFVAVKDAFDAGMKAIKPGVTFSAVNKVMEEEYKKHGMTLCSYQGHQIGCNVNELPRFTYMDESIIEENMVLCIEPQMYAGERGKTGVRLERMLHVSKEGAVSLNKFPWGISTGV